MMEMNRDNANLLKRYTSTKWKQKSGGSLRCGMGECSNRISRDNISQISSRRLMWFYKCGLPA